jgi:uncharacterized protein (DUF486 family)
MNTTLTEGIVRLWGVGLYEFCVTAWNRWGQSKLRVNDTVTIAENTSSTVVQVQMNRKKTPIYKTGNRRRH